MQEKKYMETYNPLLGKQTIKNNDMSMKREHECRKLYWLHVEADQNEVEEWEGRVRCTPTLTYGTARKYWVGEIESSDFRPSYQEI